MEVAVLSFTSWHSFIVVIAVTLFFSIFAVVAVRFSPFSSQSLRGGRRRTTVFTTERQSKDIIISSSSDCNGVVLAAANGGEMPSLVAAAEKQTGASMMEQLVPEITTHALSYLDYPSLCRLSMTNSLMRKAANDDNAWKALYHKVYLC